MWEGIRTAGARYSHCVPTRRGEGPTGTGTGTTGTAGPLTGACLTRQRPSRFGREGVIGAFRTRAQSEPSRPRWARHQASLAEPRITAATSPGSAKRRQGREPATCVACRARVPVDDTVAVAVCPSLLLPNRLLIMGQITASSRGLSAIRILGSYCTAQKPRGSHDLHALQNNLKQW